jgi:predicted PurR-regulated permease PerM
MYRSLKLQRLFVLGCSGPLLALNIWLLSQVFRYFQHPITIMLVAAILAFLLNYPVRLFERARIGRSQAVILVLILALTLLTVLGVTLLPVILDQFTQLLNKIPGWLEGSQQNLNALDAWAKSRRLPVDLKGLSGQLTTLIESQIQTLATQALNLALGTLSGFVNAILVIVLAFYMLLYGDRLWQGLINLLPPKLGVALSVSLQLNLHNFLISQLLLSFFMFSLLTPIFLVLQVPFALLFALLIGVAELIPFVGATLGIASVTLLVAFQNVWLAPWVAGSAIFLQQIKDNILAPKLMGNFTGLNPIWIFIALLMGAHIAGLLGVIVAVPLAGTIKGTVDSLRSFNAPESGLHPDTVPAEVVTDDFPPL